ncbi:glucarate dehydratase family protein [Amycolatopsis suaedae]|uniref:glucarate dehydratase n=1 Tax=Amycolatopsis suaedae TaxID=2510978 RepID=A0A4Q7J0M5_9PSEU|nr:glucarate dehydratase family protein [Amycolatopsis suaedae]RZQ60278.1 glucarate dehydratase [Amycolatopsis suaedae]
MKIREVVITPVAFADPPLLNVMGVHEPYALRSILQLVCDDGVVGLGESYGDATFLDQARRIAAELPGEDVFNLPALRRIVDRVLGGEVFTDRHGLTGGFTSSKTLATVYGFFEVAMLDAQGHYLNRPVSDLLGGKARDEVDFSAYLFYKFGEHLDGRGDEWGDVRTAEALVGEARTMVDRYGFRSIKLKGGVFPPEQEIEAVQALADAFPGYPLRIDPNGGWTPATGIRVARELAGVLEYLEDPTPGIEGMAEVAAQAQMPLATNMCVVCLDHLEPALRARAIGVLLSDHHFWGGLRDTQALSMTCQAFGVGLSMHSNSHLGISLAAMVHVAAATPHLTYACDTHWPWKDTDVIEPGVLEFRGGAVRVPEGPGLGVRLDQDALARAHEDYIRCGQTKRDDTSYMKRFAGNDFEPNKARW